VEKYACNLEYPDYVLPGIYHIATQRVIIQSGDIKTNDGAYYRNANIMGIVNGANLLFAQERL